MDVPQYILVEEDNFKNVIDGSDSEAKLLELMAHEKIANKKETVIYGLHIIKRPWVK